MERIYKHLLFTILLVALHGLLHAQISETSATPTLGCPDTFSTTLTGTNYYWYFGPNAVTPVDSGTNLQSVLTYFLASGTTQVKVAVLTTCCGLVTDSATISVSPSALNITLNISPNTICQGTQTTLIAAPTGYHAYSFFVNNMLTNIPTAANTFNIDTLVPGDSIYVIGFNGVCYTNPSPVAYPTVYPIPGAATFTSSAPSDTICSGDTVTFTATPAGLGIYCFYIGGSLQQNTASNTFLTDQLYNGNVVYVIVQKNGCLGLPSSFDTMVVHPTPFVTLSAVTDSICPGGAYIFDATSSVGGSIFNLYVDSVYRQSSTQSFDTLFGLNTGDILYVIGSALSCISRPSNGVGVFVTANTHITLNSNVTPGDSTCEGYYVTFTASPSYYSAYYFYNNDTLLDSSSSISPVLTTILTNNNHIYVRALGCPVNSDTLSIAVKPSPSVYGGPYYDSSCLSAPPVQLTGFTPAGGTWSGPGVTGTGLFSPSVAGVGLNELSYTIDSSNGCSGFGYTEFSVDAPVAEVLVTAASTSTSNDGGALVTVLDGVPPFTIIWTLPNGDTLPDLGSVGPGTYYLAITDAYSCSWYDTVVITVFGINNPRNQTGFKLFPNPANNFIELNIMNPVSNKVYADIKDVSGQILIHQIINPMGKNELDISALPAGLYFIQLQDGQQNLVGKFVKE